ncbi:hypothetical protein [Garciella nitratireducens]|uniref:Uncharacterized protein n=1 Tax=Garciella nitratireducens DSM 15102 TaxID=1121911 RepID=A0A1T4P8A5_9FIRM|nr:hypothetical protein [Garciella nitratireducens]SJZ87456.1 hypothetical protein SAMN02745973_01958 [Garciella nitratireducens DSM 15102]
MYELFSFLNDNKLSFYKLFCIISFFLFFVRPIYGVATFGIITVLLAYCEQIVEYFEKKDKKKLHK